MAIVITGGRSDTLNIIRDGITQAQIDFTVGIPAIVRDLADVGWDPRRIESSLGGSYAQGTGAYGFEISANATPSTGDFSFSVNLAGNLYGFPVGSEVSLVGNFDPETGQFRIEDMEAFGGLNIIQGQFGEFLGVSLGNVANVQAGVFFDWNSEDGAEIFPGLRLSLTQGLIVGSATYTQTVNGFKFAESLADLNYEDARKVFETLYQPSFGNGVGNAFDHFISNNLLPFLTGVRNGDQLPHTWGNFIDELGLKESDLTFREILSGLQMCFVAGTMIEMWDGTRKPIELIRKWDEVVSYDKDGNLVKGIVTETFTNQATHVLEWYGTGVTPGHVTYCSNGEFEGQHVPLIDIMLSDGGVMKMDGTKVRANTNWEIGSEMDRMVQVMAAEKMGVLSDLLRVSDRGEMRLGQRFIDDDGKEWTLKDLIDAQAKKNGIEFGYGINDEGYVQRKKADGTIDSEANFFPFLWPYGDRYPRPWDYVIKQKSGISLAEIVKADEWESMRSTIIDRERFEYAFKKFKKLPDHIDKSNPHNLQGMQLQLYPDTKQ